MTASFSFLSAERKNSAPSRQRGPFIPDNSRPPPARCRHFLPPSRGRCKSTPDRPNSLTSRVTTINACPSPLLSSRRRKVIGPCPRREEQLLQVRPGHPLHSLPLIDRNEHSDFRPAPCHDLRPFCESNIQQFIESRLGNLNRPSSALHPPLLYSV